MCTDICVRAQDAPINLAHLSGLVRTQQTTPSVPRLLRSSRVQQGFCVCRTFRKAMTPAGRYSPKVVNLIPEEDAQCSREKGRRSCLARKIGTTRLSCGKRLHLFEPCHEAPDWRRLRRFARPVWMCAGRRWSCQGYFCKNTPGIFVKDSCRGTRSRRRGAACCGEAATISPQPPPQKGADPHPFNTWSVLYVYQKGIVDLGRRAKFVREAAL